MSARNEQKNRPKELKKIEKKKVLNKKPFSWTQWGVIFAGITAFAAVATAFVGAIDKISIEVTALQNKVSGLEAGYAKIGKLESDVANIHTLNASVVTSGNVQTSECPEGQVSGVWFGNKGTSIGCRPTPIVR